MRIQSDNVYCSCGFGGVARVCISEVVHIGVLVELLVVIGLLVLQFWCCWCCGLG